jgi:hypothetical protein
MCGAEQAANAAMTAWYRELSGWMPGCCRQLVYTSSVLRCGVVF